MFESLSTSTPISRKDRQCVWCPEKIVAGERHVLEVGKFDGDFQSNRYHAECRVASERYFKDGYDNWSGEFEECAHKRGSTEER